MFHLIRGCRRFVDLWERVLRSFRGRYTTLFGNNPLLLLQKMFSFPKAMGNCCFRTFIKLSILRSVTYSVVDYW